ncbi:MAG TPA: hypothetical protein VFU76_09505 [Terriglobales bacterium]|nr:hypothetical protein [Terriglobales bacterium]
MTPRKTWLAVFLFATAMAWMESATVAYLRTLVQRVVPYQANPLPLAGIFGATELVREIATMLMLIAVGILAGRNTRTRIAYAVLAFGIWDILYYVFLMVIVGWPRSLWDWDVLFLLPLPWWGPVLAPGIIALFMIAGATLVTQWEHRRLWPRRWALALNALGAFIALGVFMEDAIRALPGGEAAIRAALPERFDWPWFAAALLLMFATLADLIWQLVGCQLPVVSYGDRKPATDN